jgi:hypothetical protein
VTTGDVSDDEMPNFPWSDRRDASWIEDAALASLLARTELPTDSGAGLRSLAEVLAVLGAPADSEELAGEAAAMTAFRHQFGAPARQPRRSRRRRPALVASLLSARTVAVAAIAAACVGAAATSAAFAGALPDPLQQFAHQIFGAPAAHEDKASAAHPSASSTPAGPNARGSAAFGLCSAYKRATAHGTPAQRAVAFHNLVKAAGGAGKVAAFCAAAPQPVASPPPHPTGPPSTHPTGQPSPHPTGPPSTHPTGPPSPHPTGPPSKHR